MCIFLYILLRIISKAYFCTVRKKEHADYLVKEFLKDPVNESYGGKWHFAI